VGLGVLSPLCPFVIILYEESSICVVQLGGKVPATIDIYSEHSYGPCVTTMLDPEKVQREVHLQHKQGPLELMGTNTRMTNWSRSRECERPLYFLFFYGTHASERRDVTLSITVIHCSGFGFGRRKNSPVK
jgi:hypothetical protein